MGQRLAGLREVHFSDVQQHLRILKGLNKSATALRYFVSDTADFFLIQITILVELMKIL